MVLKFKFTEIDKAIYEYIKKEQTSKEITLENIITNISFDSDSIRRSIEYLKSEDIISEKILKSIIYDIDNNGTKGLEEGLIEERFCDYLKNNKVKLSELKMLDIPKIKKEEISLAFGIAKSENLISIVNNEIKVVSNFKEMIDKTKNKLNNVKEKKEIDKSTIKEFLKRKFILKKEVLEKKYNIKKEVDYIVEDKNILYLTQDIIKTKDFKKLKFKEFDVEKLSKPKMLGRIHPLRQIIRYIKEIYIEMGFKEMNGPYVESSFWNMDSMFIAQDHPMRDIQDTFYLPITGNLPDSKLIDKVARVHENGGDTGSKGYNYKWNPEISKQLVLRTQTTSVTFRKLNELKNKDNCKYFSVGKVFRNETMDFSHLPEFHQAEGFVIGDNLGLADLMGFIKEFARKLGVKKIKFKPTYNPYTEPSVEAFAYFEKSKKWIEFINSGIFRSESLEPYGIKKNVIAWGLGVERIAMLIYQKSIKEIYGDECDLDWLRTYPLPKKAFE